MSEPAETNPRGISWLYFTAAMLSLVGLADSIYLTVEHLTGQSLRCTIISGCSEVLSSPYSHIGNLPLAALGAIWALWVRRYFLARALGVGQVVLILWGWAAAQYPFLVPPQLSLYDAAAPPATLRLLLIALIAGAVVLFPSFYYLYRVFKGPAAFEVMEKCK